MSEQDRNRTAVSYGRGPLLALGVMAGAMAVAGGVGAVAMTLDEEPSAVSDQSTVDSSDESSSDALSTGAQDGTSAEDPSGTDSTPASDPSDGAGQAKPSQGSAAQSPDEAGSSAAAETGGGAAGSQTGAGSASSGTAAEAAPGASQQAGSSSAAAGSGRHVSEAPVDAVPPTAGSANSGPRHAMPVDGSYGVVYEIRWGDTLSEIAMDEGVSTQYLADLNAIKDPDVIYAGDSLILPVD